MRAIGTVRRTVAYAGILATALLTSLATYTLLTASCPPGSACPPERPWVSTATLASDGR